MNIFDPHISGSLSVSGSGEISGDLTVLGTINATISGTTTNAISASHAAKYLLTSSFETFTGSYTTGSFTGSFKGDGSGLYNIPASGVTGLNLTRIADGSATASISNVDGLRVNTNTEITGALAISGSITLNGVPVGTGKLDETTFNSYTSSVNTYTGNTQLTIATLSTTASVDTLSGSIATTDLNQNNRLNAIETSTGSLNSFTSSINTTIKSKLDTESVISGSVQVNITGTTGYSTFSSSISSSIGSLSGSVAATTLGLGNRVGSIETTTSSLNSFTSSIDTTIKNKLNTENVLSGSAQVSITGVTGYSTFSSSVSSSINSLSSSIATTDSGQNNRLGSIETFTSSINTTIKSKLDADGVLSGSGQVSLTGVNGYSTFSSSIATTDLNQNNRLDSIETSTGSLNSFTSSINTTIKSKLNTEGVISGSVQVDITNATNYTTFSSSIATTDLGQNTRLNSIEGKTGSYATTGSNVFVGAQTISGSVIIRENLTVLGSSSIVYVTSSQLRIDDNIITVNTSSPGSRFGGLEVYDSGSVTQATGSILWDSVNNRWIYQQSSEATYGGGVLMSGPRSSGSLGSELTLTSNKVAKSAGGDHLNDSNITDTGTIVSINSNTEITGTLLITSTIVSQGTSLVSGSGQISYAGITNVPSGIISGSAQVTSLLPAGTVSGSSQVLAGTTIHSGSFFNGITVVSGSGQISFNGITDKPTLVSGSSQISFLSVSGIPTGLVSGSSQVLSGTGIWSGSAQLPSGVVSGSVQVTLSSTTGFGSYIDQAVLTTSSPTFAGLTVNGSSKIANSTSINPSGYTNSVVAGGVGQTGWGVTSGVGGNAGVNMNWAIGHNGSKFYFGLSNGSATLSTWMEVATNKTITLNGYTTNGFVKFSNSDGTLAVDTNTYQTVGSTFYIGTTSIANNRSSASQSLTGISSIDGTASGINSSAPTLAVASESNSIYVTAPSYTTGQITKPLIFDWYGNYWAIGNIRSGATPSSGFGIAFTGITPTHIFTTTGLSIAGNTAIHSGNYSTYASPLAGSSSITTVGTISSGTWNGTTIAVANGGTGATTAAGARTNLGLVIGTDVLAYRTFGTAASSNTGDFAAYNATTYVGTTAIALNRSSASQTLTGISIDGNAATVTNGVYTSGDQTITGQKTFPTTIGDRPILGGGFISALTGDLNTDIWGISEDYYPSHATAANAWGIRWSGDTNDIQFVGGGSNRFIFDLDNGNLTAGGTLNGLTVSSGTISSGTWNGTTIAVANGGTGATTAAGARTNLGLVIGTDVLAYRTFGTAASNNTGDFATAAQGTKADNALPLAGGTMTGNLLFSNKGINMKRDSGANTGISWYSTSYSSWCDYMSPAAATGCGPNGNITAPSGTYVTSWGLRRFIEDSAGYGWTWESGTSSQTTPSVKAELRASDGLFSVAGAIYSAGNLVKTTANSSYSTTFTSVTSVTVTHNLGTKNVGVFLYDSSDNMFWPSTIVTTSTSVVTITFASSRSGRVVVFA